MLLVGYQAHLIHDLLIVSVVALILRSSCCLKELLEADLWGLIIMGEQGEVVLIVTYEVINAGITRPSLGKPVLEGSEATSGLHVPS